MIGPWRGFSRTQRKNIAIYVVGIMFYKFALEWYNGAFITLANERFGDDRYSNIGILTGLNYAMQCVGSIIVAPLIKRYPTRSVLSTAVFVFGFISAILLIVDASTGGVMRFRTEDNTTKYGTWNPKGVGLPSFAYRPKWKTDHGNHLLATALSNIYHLRDIVGGDVQLVMFPDPDYDRDSWALHARQLRQMDATVHVLYEVAGTIGAFSSVSLIGKFGYNYSFFLSPVFFTFAAITWRFVDGDRPKLSQSLEEFESEPSSPGYLPSVWSGFRSFFKATYYGAFLVFSHRKFVWLVSGYALALYGHRYLENGLAPVFAKQVLGTSAWSQIIVGGSNLGELFGAVSVLITSNYVRTPLPWLRLDAIALNIVWILPFISVTRGKVADAWKIAAIFLPISYGWAAGDVSLAAYIQATLAKIESRDSDVSALGSVMAFLYVLYIVLYSILSTVLGRWIDNQVGSATGDAAAASARVALKYIGGVQFTVLCVVVMVSTFIPRGSFAFNPKDEDFNVDQASNFDNRSLDLRSDELGFVKTRETDTHSESFRV
ncbi:hypothetical protein V5O48_001468 [Marasmius crinis-equi]|uniref:Uncharacterized protein n=1 Tax=Marasmius crinis-equi TaxID=585013 RepID=A0ABR3FZJ9_9AGAR